MATSICVVLDSSVLYRDYKLSGASLRGLLGVAASCKAPVFLPGVVFDELLHQHGEDYAETKKRMEEILERFRGMSMVKVPFSFRDSRRSYSDSLRRLLKQKGMRLLDYPRATHQQMVQRFYEYSKPLGKHKDKRVRDDAGYRDALIWENVLELLDNGFTTIVLVSNDVEDFGDADVDGLHRDLIDDLARHGHNRDAVKYCKSLKEGTDLLRAICPRGGPALDERLARRIKRNVDFDELLTLHQNEIADAIEGSGEILVGELADQPSLMWNVEGSEVEIESTEVLEESGEVVVYANARFKNEIEYYASLSDYYCSEERFDERRIYLYGEYGDIDRVLVGGDMEFALQFNFIYKRANHEASGFEVVDIQRVDVSQE